jgi:hypothetical protein
MHLMHTAWIPHVLSSTAAPSLPLLTSWPAAGRVVLHVAGHAPAVRPVPLRAPAPGEEGAPRECAVCLETYTRNADWAVFACGHATCRPCYAKLLQRPGRCCPLCRQPLVEPVGEEAGAAPAAGPPRPLGHAQTREGPQSSGGPVAGRVPHAAWAPQPREGVQAGASRGGGHGAGGLPAAGDGSAAGVSPEAGAANRRLAASPRAGSGAPTASGQAGPAAASPASGQAAAEQAAGNRRPAPPVPQRPPPGGDAAV